MTDFSDANGIGRMWQAIKKYLSYSNLVKTTLADADYVLLTDSADTESANSTTIQKIKRITVANLKTALGTGGGGTTIYKNRSVAAQGGGTVFATDTYLVGSRIVFPSAPQVGTRYKCIFDVTKTAVGTATPIINVRVGTAGTTADTSRGTLTFGAGTTAIDTGLFEVIVVFRTVGGTTTAVIQSISRLTSNLTTTGLSNVKKAVLATSGGFDSTVASLGIGLSYNGGTSAVHTIQLVSAELVM